MRIFIKFILKNTIEKKGRLVLLLAAISLSTGLFIASQQAMKTALLANEKTQYEMYEKKDIRIASSDGTSSLTAEEIDLTGLKDFEAELLLQNIKQSKNVRVAVHGRDRLEKQDYQIVKGKLADIRGAEIVISQRISETRNLELGDTIQLAINDEKHTFTVSAIAETAGIFYNDQKDAYAILMDYDGLKDIADAEYNQALAKADSSTEKAVETFNKNNENYTASNLYDQGAMAQITTQVETIFTLMFVFVALISMLIIYQAFKLLITERMKVIGTFLSQGATFNQITGIFLLESLLYSLLGGAVGIGLGYGLIIGITRLTSPLAEFGIYEKTPGLPLQTAGSALLFAVFLGIISAIVPALRVRRLPIKAVILSEPIAEKNQGWLQPTAGVLFVLFSAAAVFLELPIGANAIALLCGFIGCILLYPKLLGLFGNGLFRILRGRASAFAIALKNISTSKILQGNVTLLFISLLILLLISSLSGSMRGLLTSMYQELNYDISVQTDFDGTSTPHDEVAEKTAEESFITENGKGSHRSIQTSGAIKNNTFLITAVDNMKEARNFYHYLGFEHEDFDEMFTLLNMGYTFITSKTHAQQLGLKAGDTVKMKISDTETSFTLAGTYDNKAMNSFVLIKQTDLPDLVRQTASVVHYYQINGKQTEAKNKLEDLLEDYPVTITTKNKLMADNLAQNDMMLNMVTAFAVMTAVIGSLGMVSNVTIAFLQRKKDFAVYESVGMAPDQRLRIFLGESLLAAVVSFLLTLSIVFLEINLLGKVLSEVINVSFSIQLDYRSLPLLLLLAILIMLISSVPALLNSRRLNTVEELKRE